ncbi:MAG: sterol desaturase family protein [Novosphingobium sp.]|uniref:sterol desaturase family protein n=1 Tax=Novosphingobium sp. TaxID=1874826 RepID=UPI0032B90352
MLSPSITVIIVLTLLERRAGHSSGDWWINLQSFAISTAGAFSIYAWVKPWQAGSLIEGEALPAWAGVVLFILVQDLGENLYHRLQHRIPILWEMHSLHHSDPDMAVLTTYRHFWADRLIKTVTVYSLAGMIISPTPLAAMGYFAISMWNFVAHANLDWNFGKWSWAINSPAYHRRHHSSAPEHYDSNFAALFPFFDVLLGGYNVPSGRPETGFERRPHGLIDQLIWPFIGKHRKAPGAEVSGQA